MPPLAVKKAPGSPGDIRAVATGNERSRCRDSAASRGAGWALRAGIAVAVLLASLPANASAHAGGSPAGDGGRGWLATIAIAAGLALAGGLYARGAFTIWRRAGGGRGLPPWRAAAFMLGLLALWGALLSPLDRMSEELFAAHMVQHVLLMLAAAPLLVLGAPLAPMLWGLPGAWRRRSAYALRAVPMQTLRAFLTHPLTVGVIGVAALWLWHMPRLYEAALRGDLAHALEHASFLGAALLFWGIVLPAGRRQVQAGAALLLIFVTMLQSGGLGALIVFARSPLYAAHEAGAAAWGLTPLQDQQLAGPIMWVPMGVAYLLAAIWVVAAWLRALERTNPTNAQPLGDRVIVPRASEGGAA